jgi:hypothetical protein
MGNSSMSRTKKKTNTGRLPRSAQVRSSVG